MSADDNDHDELEDTDDVRDRIERRQTAHSSSRRSEVELLRSIDTETRAQICVHLRQQLESTSEETAEGTGRASTPRAPRRAHRGGRA